MPADTLPSWLRIALFATTGLNLVGAVVFAPPMRPLQLALGYPDAPDLHLWALSTMIGVMAVAYGWMAWTNVPNRLMLAVGSAGKLCFAATLLVGALLGDLPASVGLGGLPDLVLGLMFAAWLVSTASGSPTR